MTKRKKKQNLYYINHHKNIVKKRNESLNLKSKKCLKQSNYLVIDSIYKYIYCNIISVE